MKTREAHEEEEKDSERESERKTILVRIQTNDDNVYPSSSASFDYFELSFMLRGYIHCWLSSYVACLVKHTTEYDYQILYRNKSTFQCLHVPMWKTDRHTDTELETQNSLIRL